MSESSVVYYILANNAVVSAIVGTKIFPQRATQAKAFPFIVYNTISIVPTNSLGAGGTSTLDKCRVQIDLVCETQLQCESLAAAVRSALDYYCISNTTISGQVVNNIQFDSQYNSFADNAGQEGIFMISQDYLISIIR